MLSNKQLKLLKQVCEGGVPEQLTERSGVDLKELEDLIHYGLIDGEDYTNSSGPLFVNVKISFAGRNYLNDINNNASEDIIELKPNIWGMGININALLRKKKK